LINCGTGTRCEFSNFRPHEIAFLLQTNPHYFFLFIFQEGNDIKIAETDFPQFRLGECLLKYVNQFKYLGNLTDDDIQREVHNLCVCTNILLRKFGKFSFTV